MYVASRDSNFVRQKHTKTHVHTTLDEIGEGGVCEGVWICTQICKHASEQANEYVRAQLPCNNAIVYVRICALY